MAGSLRSLSQTSCCWISSNGRSSLVATIFPAVSVTQMETPKLPKLGLKLPPGS